jgi:hypothetical protein
VTLFAVLWIAVSCFALLAVMERRMFCCVTLRVLRNDGRKYTFYKTLLDFNGKKMNYCLRRNDKKWIATSVTMLLLRSDEKENVLPCYTACSLQ